VDLTRPVALTLLGLIPLLWWLALPPRPRRVVATAHLPLWEIALRKLRRESERFRPLRFWLLVGAFVAATTAVAGPVIRGRPGAGSVAVLVDNSASMGAREPDGTCAFDALRTGLRDRIGGLPPELRYRWAYAGPDGDPVVGRGRAEDLVEALDRLVLRKGPSLDLARTASLLVTDEPRTAVWAWTDGRGAWASDGIPGAVELVGAPGLPNAAWVRLDVEDSWPLSDIRLHGTVVWSGGAPRPDVAVVGSAVEVLQLDVLDGDASGQARVDIRVHRIGAGRVELRLARVDGRGEWIDAQPGDDVVAVDIVPPGASRLGLRSGEGDGPSSWLQRSALLLAELTGGEVVLPEPSDEVDLLLVEGGKLRAPVARSLTFGTGFGERAGDPPGLPPVVVDWDRRHPLTRGLDLSELRIRGPGQRVLPEGDVLIVGDAGPLAVGVEGDRGRSVHFGFGLEDSNLPYLAAYPQLLRRALTWTAGIELSAVEVYRGDEDEARLVRSAALHPHGLPLLATPDQSLVGVFLLVALGLLAVRSQVR
jgi:hypothetical protein